MGYMSWVTSTFRNNLLEKMAVRTYLPSLGVQP